MWFEIIGYAASLMIALSLMMNSIIRLRIYGLMGAILFCTYGFIISAYPVAFLNLLNASVHTYYLLKIRKKKEIFKILEVRPENKYLIYFIECNKEKIKHFFPHFQYKHEEENYLTFFVVRNLSVAGVFIGKRVGENTLEIILDFVIPEYRDFKIGNFIYADNINFFKTRNFFKLICQSHEKAHVKYLKKMGFIIQENGCCILNVEKN
ncbi:MAG: hypothetical protein PHT69_13230 [Bacteroidales bacterium]|nr:hypothetical protein [Bacteroidales bacterium]